MKPTWSSSIFQGYNTS